MKFKLVETHTDELNEDYSEDTNTCIGIRYTYNGVGIYQALKEAVGWNLWKELKQSKSINWLPVPEIYGSTDKDLNSYFTETGDKKFTELTLPEITKYLDKDKITKVTTQVDKSKIVYEDSFQFVASNG